MKAGLRATFPPSSGNKEISGEFFDKQTKITIVRILRFRSIGGIRDDDGSANLCGTFIELAHICQDERLKEAPTMFKPIFETESKPNLAFLRSMFFRCVIFISMISLISSTLNLVFGIWSNNNEGPPSHRRGTAS